MRELHDKLENNLDLKCSGYSCTNITIIIQLLCHRKNCYGKSYGCGIGIVGGCLGI
jgi:hypothetical protein